MHGHTPPFRAGGGGFEASQLSQQQQVHLNPNFLPNPNLFLFQQNPNLLAQFNPFFQSPNTFPQVYQQFPNIDIPVQLNSVNTGFQAQRPNEINNTTFPQQHVKVQKEMVEKVDKAARSAWNDLLNSNKNVSAWKVSQAALLSVKAESWECLGFQMQQVPSLKSILVTEGKINAFIHCFVAATKITSLYDLEVAVCKNEGVKQFEELELGPLVQHPLAVHYFSLTSKVTEVYRIKTEEIISYLCEFIDTHKTKDINVDTFLDFICKKESVSCWENLCVRVHDFRLYVNHIIKAKQSEDGVLVRCYERIRTESEKSSKKRPLFSVQEKEMDEHVNTISQPLKSKSSEKTKFCGRHVRFMPSSSEDDDSEANQCEENQDGKNVDSSCNLLLPNGRSKLVSSSQPLKAKSSEKTKFCGRHVRFMPSSSEDDECEANQCEENQDGKNVDSNCNLSLPNGRKNLVSSCPYPSAIEEMRRLEFKREVESTSYVPSSGVMCDTDNKHPRGKRRYENMSSCSSFPRKLPKKEKFDADVKLKGSDDQSISGHSHLLESSRKDARRNNNEDEVLERMLPFYNTNKKRKVKEKLTSYSSVLKRKHGICLNWPPVDWKTAPGFESVGASGLKTPRSSNFQIQEGGNFERTDICVDDISSEFDIEANPTTQGAVLVEAEVPESLSKLPSNLVASNLNVVLDSVDLVSPDGKDFASSVCSEKDTLLTQQALLTGRLGELVAFKYFTGNIGERTVKWVNEANETGLPYDIILEGDENTAEYIEVKATRFGRKSWFHITMREWQFAIEKGEAFSIAHVVLADDNMARVTIYKNLARLCLLGNLKLLVVPKES